MRLLNVHSLRLESFFGKQLPPYAILSHRWGPDDEELTFRDVQANNLDKPGIGSVKLRGCIAQAKADKMDYIWVDTFCINKADDATELTKAINSMFAWYQGAAVCYVYLCDFVDAPMPEWHRLFAASQWFRRGWTLQELLAPSHVRFFNRQWIRLGTKQSLSAEVDKATGISAGFLEGVWRLDDASIAQRMSWAAGRVTKEPEDMAYSLLGIFGVNMPLIYGEGANAFTRLQEEISKKLSDDSILAWGMPRSTTVPDEAGAVSPPGSSSSILASSPADFLNSGNIVFNSEAPPMHWLSGSGSLGIEMALHTSPTGQIYGLLQCHAADDSGKVVGIPLERLSTQRSNDYVRSSGCPAIFLCLEAARKDGQILPPAPIRTRVSPLAKRNKGKGGPSRFWIKGLVSMGLQVVETSPDGCWNASNSTVTAPADGPAWQQIWVRLRKSSVTEQTFDFILLLSNDPATQERAQPSSNVQMAVCSRTASLPPANYRGVAPTFDSSDRSARLYWTYMSLELLQSEQFIGAKSTHVIELQDTNKRPYYVDLTNDFYRMKIEEDIIESLEKCDELLRARVNLEAMSRTHDKHINTLDSSIETLDRTIARIQRMRSSLALQRKGAAKVQEIECSELYTYDSDSGYYPLDQYDNIVNATLHMLEGGSDGKPAHSAGQAPDALFERIIGHVSGGVDVKRPTGWTSRETAVYQAACHGEDGPLNLLKSLGGDLEKALLWCTKDRRTQGVETLLRAGASPDGPKDCDESPLVKAILASSKEIVEMLLDHGASINVIDKDGCTPREAAEGVGDSEIERTLLRHEKVRQDETNAQVEVERALNKICWSLDTEDHVKERYEAVLFDYGFPELMDR